MKNFLKGKIGTVAIVIATLILAGVAIFTAIRLYQLRQQAVAPTAPESKPEAGGGGISKCQSLTLKIPGASPTATPTPANCNKSCNETVSPPITCKTGLICFYTSTLRGAPGVCRNPSCKLDTDCVCPTATPTTPTSTPTPTPEPGEPNDCGGTCGSNSNCKSNLFCFEGICRNPSCSAEEDCTCAGGGGTPTPTPKPIAGGGGTRTTTPTEPTVPPEEIPTEEPSLPAAGASFPTIIGTVVGILLLIGALLLAL